MLECKIRATVGPLSLQADLAADLGVTVLIGPNGAGKSSLLKCLLGVVPNCSGKITLGGRTLLDSDAGIDVLVEERRIGYVPQNYGLFEHLSVFQNIAFGLKNQSKQDREEKIGHLLSDLEIDHLSAQKAGTLSGGESQRVALARALAIDPDAILLDEPTAALDANARRRVRRFLTDRLQTIAVPTIVVSHDLDEVAALGGNIVVLERGAIRLSGPLGNISESAADESEFLRQFLTIEPK